MNFYGGNKNTDKAGRVCSDGKKNWIGKFILQSQVMLTAT